MASKRNKRVDIARGTVMVLMVLDHARAFFMGPNIVPMDLATTSPVLFGTRWITHFCAPTFVFLAGLSAYFHSQKNSIQNTRSFLFKRGVWLVFLELTLIKLGWIPEPFYQFVLLQVIWILGLSMICMSLFLYIPRKLLLPFFLLIVVGHNALDLIPSVIANEWGWWWKLLHKKGAITLGQGRLVFVSYPLIPWPAIMGLGFVLGPVLNEDKKRQKVLLLGTFLVSAFVVLRFLNIYGDPSLWSMQATWTRTVLSFLKLTKYPPSLLFLLATLGPLLIFLGWKNTNISSPRWLITLGRTPMFFYILHLYILRFSSALVGYLRYGNALLKPPPGPMGSPELTLPFAYLACLICLLLAFPLCRWFEKKKQTSRSFWVRYF